MINPKIKNLLAVVVTTVIGTIIITLPMRLLLDRYQPSEKTSINQ